MPTNTVSIPFKRESGAKVRYSLKLILITMVSIPFKRESGAKGEYAGREVPHKQRVSIPFKRESGAKGRKG